MKTLFFFLYLLLIMPLLSGCFNSGSKPQNFSVTGTVYFGGEPSSALADPSASSLMYNKKNNNASDLLILRQTSPGPPNSLIVTVNAKLSLEEQQKILENLGFNIHRRMISDQNSYVVIPRSMNIHDAYESAKRSLLINTVEYNYAMVKQSTTPDDPYYDRQWDLRVTKFNEAWDNFKGRDEVIVAVIDTGLNTASSEFVGRLTPPETWYDFVDGDTDPNDNKDYSGHPPNHYSHGTNVAGIIGANPNNNYGYAGAAWDNSKIKILPLRVLDESGYGSLDALVDSIYWAILHHAKVINLSLGMSGNNDSVLLNNAVHYAYSKGVTIICAAGNENTAINYPARLAADYPNVIAVGATGYTNQKAWYSCFGPELTVMAPGGDDTIDGTDFQKYIWNITYNKSDRLETDDEMDCGFIGTSQATPHVSALAALLYSYGVTSPAKIRNIISHTATDLGPEGRDNQNGYGLINAFAALTATTANITEVTVGIRDPITKNNLVNPVNPNYSGVYSFSGIPKGEWELYAEYTGLTNGYKYYVTTEISVTGNVTRDLTLQLIPNP